MKASQKVEALKNNKLDPTEIKDPYDQLAHALHLWTELGRNTLASTSVDKQQVANNFYDGLLAPAYKKLGLEPISRDLWNLQAFNEALNYKIEDAYGNSWLQTIRHGLNSGLASTARAYGVMSNALGYAVEDAVGLWKKRMAQGAANDDQFETHSWHQQLKDLHNDLAEIKHDSVNAVTRGAEIQANDRQFWADAIPARNGMLNYATNMTVEGVGQLPIFAALSLGNTVAGAALPETLTAALEASPLGKKVSGYLLAGGEGLAYGTLAAKQDDPGEKWRDAINFTIFHGLFDIGGMGLRKLKDLYTGTPTGAQLDKVGTELERRMAGNRTATPVEAYEAHKAETANNIVVAGIPGQITIHAKALQWVQETQELNPGERAAAEKQVLGQDPAYWSPVLSAARYVRMLVPSGKKLADLSPEELKPIQEKLQQLTLDAASELNTHAKGMEEANKEAAAKNLKQPSAKHTLDYYIRQVQAELAKTPGAAALVTKEQIQAAAEGAYAKDLQLAAEHAEQEVGQSKTEQAANIAKRAKPVPALKVRSERKIGKSGDVSVSYSVTPDYKVRLAQHKKAAMAVGQSLKSYFADLSDEDFLADLNDYFYPKVLRDAEVFFENQHVAKQGMQNPNFLAFMSNYADHMPKEYADELQQRLIDSAKVQKHINGRALTEPQLDYYAKAMYNHVDNFLGSGHWPKESDIFRSSNESIFKTTKWQKQLLVEKMVKEREILGKAFSGKKNAEALKQATALYDKLSQLRLSEFDNANIKAHSQDKIKTLNNNIADLLTSTGKYVRWDF